MYVQATGVPWGEWQRGPCSHTRVVQAGVWREGQLETALEDVQCSLAVEGANEAAAVARRVQVGEGTLGGALGLLLADPTTWAYGAALVLAVLQRPLTPTVGGAAVGQGCAGLNRAVGLYALWCWLPREERTGGPREAEYR